MTSAPMRRCDRYIRLALWGRVGLSALLLALSTCPACSAYQKFPPPEIAPPENPGDKCAELGSAGGERPCPEGMKCADVRWDRRTKVGAGHCALLKGRCATSSDCQSNETCIRNTMAIGYCAQSPGLTYP
jgi:hypothetical protein